METSARGRLRRRECVEHNGHLLRPGRPALRAGKVLAATISGTRARCNAGTVQAAKLKIMGVDVFSAGDWTDAGGAEPVRYEDPASGIYKKIVVRDASSRD